MGARNSLINSIVERSHSGILLRNSTAWTARGENLPWSHSRISISLVMKFRGILLPLILFHGLLSDAPAQTWDGGGSPNTWWTIASNWNGDTVPFNDGTANILL